MRQSMNELRKANPGLDLKMQYNRPSKSTPLPQSNTAVASDYANGGLIGVDWDAMKGEMTAFQDVEQAEQLFEEGEEGLGMGDYGYDPSKGIKLRQAVGKGKEWLKSHKGDILRGAPFAANAYQLAKLEKAPGVRSDRLDKKFKPDYADEQALYNISREQIGTTRRGLTEASGGDKGALMTNLLALNKASNLGTSFLQAEDINRRQNVMGQQFDLGVAQQNIAQSNLDEQINAANIGAFNTAQSQLISQLGTDTGNLGKEEKFRQMVKESGLCYDARGSYICGTGERVNAEDLEKYGKTPGFNETTQTNEGRYGGYNKSSTKMFNTYLDTLLK